MGKNTFRWRAFVSFLLLLSFLLSGISGLFLFLRPEGSLAAWSGWSALGVDKKGWEALHAVATFYFLLGTIAHLAFNWRALLAYCRRQTAPVAATLREKRGCRELAIALLLSGLVLAAALGGWFPARWIIDMRAGFKSGTAVVDVAPPVVDAEQRTLAELCPLLGTDESRLLAAARSAGIRVESPAQTLADVAKKNGLSPEDLYIRLWGKGAAHSSNK